MPATLDVKDATGTTRTVATNDALAALVGEEQASPTSNTLLDPGPARQIAPADVSLSRRYGVEIDTSDLPAVRWDGPFGLVGWVSLSVSVAANWVTAGTSGGPAK